MVLFKNKSKEVKDTCLATEILKDTEELLIKYEKENNPYRLALVEKGLIGLLHNYASK